MQYAWEINTDVFKPLGFGVVCYQKRNLTYTELENLPIDSKLMSFSVPFQNL